MTDNLVLSDLGERRIVEEILRPRYGHWTDTFGDDCATLTFDARTLVVTTDPCPYPMAHLLGFNDEYFRGWLLGTINLSDLAAAGATPLGLLTSLVLPASMLLDDFRRLLDGIDDCCRAADTRVIGGNLKDGNEIDVQATAIGSVSGTPLGRQGTETGDLLLAAGPTGSFWAAVTAIRAGTAPTDLAPGLLEAVQTPTPQLAFGQELQQSGIRCAVMDNSDGLGSSLNTLAVTNGVGMLIDLDSIDYGEEVAEVSRAVDIDPARFALGWGDWNLLVSVKPTDADAVAAIAQDTATPITQVAVARLGSGVHATRAGRELAVEAPDSERFTADSWFRSGIETYIERLLGFPLP